MGFMGGFMDASQSIMFYPGYPDLTIHPPLIDADGCKPSQKLGTTLYLLLGEPYDPEKHYDCYWIHMVITMLYVSIFLSRAAYCHD